MLMKYDILIKLSPDLVETSSRCREKQAKLGLE